MKRREMKQTSIISKGLLITLIVTVFITSLEGQQKEVRVVKPYSPTLSGAEKIQLLPELDEEIELEPPEFTYQLYPKRYPSAFRVEPIKAARMVQMPLKKLYKSELTVGLGNYWTPYAELNINQLRSRDGTFGLSLKHHSMNGKLKLEDDRKIPAGFSESSLEVKGSRFLKKTVFDYRAGVSYDSYVHYGFDPDTLEVSQVPERDSLKHPYFTAEASLGLHSIHADSSRFNYDATLDYYYLTHRFDQVEHGAKANLEFHKDLRLFTLAGELGGAFYGHYPDWDTTIGNHTMAWLKPHIARGSSEWRFSAGFNMYLSFINGFLGDSSQVFHLYPYGTFEFNVVKEVIVPYFGIDGYLESNNNRKTVQENPYIIPTLSLQPTNHRLIIFAGLKGRFSDAVAYNLKGSYSLIDDQYFFVNDTSQVDYNGDTLGNQFTVEYNDIALLNLQGELTVRPSDKWKVFLKGNYYLYTMGAWSNSTLDTTWANVEGDSDHPWNKPSWDISLQARYNMSNKILIDLGIYTIGKRYYEDYDPAVEEELPWVLDANLGIEYRYTKLLSFWARINNIAARQYYLYHQYPSYKFRIMLGFTYAL